MVRKQIETLLAEAIATGHLDHIDATKLADVVYTTYNGALIIWAIDGTGTLTHHLTAHVDAVVAPYTTSEI